MTDETPLEVVSDLTQFNDMMEFMNDKDLDEALSLVVKLIMKPDVPASKAPALIVKLQAISAKFGMLKRVYMTFEKGEEASKRKNVYADAEARIDKLVDSLKYIARYGA